MQPGEEIENLVNELEDIISDGKKPIMGGTGSNPKIVDADAVYELLDEIRNVFPEEFQTSRRILKEEDENLKAGNIALLGLAKNILETSIHLLGFSAPEKM